VLGAGTADCGANIEHARTAGAGRAAALELLAAIGAWHVAVPAVPPVVGNMRAVDINVERTCVGVSVGLSDSIKAAVPATSGAKKLVPTEKLTLSL
jgi:hypothetical protein